ncbi:putative signal transduction histidine kinase, dimerization/phosphoacceptor [Helianthus anomalus]
MGAFCFLQIASPELQQAMKIQRQQENNCFEMMKELAYICHEIKNPLSDIIFSNSFLESTNLTDDHKQLLEMSAACQKQMLKIVKDVDMENIQEGHLELEKHDFVLGSVIEVVVSQVMFALRDGGVQLIRDVLEEVRTLCLYIVSAFGLYIWCAIARIQWMNLPRVILLSTINHMG